MDGAKLDDPPIKYKSARRDWSGDGYQQGCAARARISIEGLGPDIAGPSLSEGAAMTTIYHNPRCSKSRATMKLLEEKGIAPIVIEYLQTPPDAKTLDGFLTKLGMEPRDLMRKGEAPYKELNLKDENKSRDELIQAMIDNPILIERPIVVNGNRVALGRPPENVLEILG